MGFLDNLKKTAESVAGTIKEGASQAADKAKDFAETQKQKAAISDAEKNITSVYAEMGQALLEQFPDKAKELFPDQLLKIDEFKAAIATAEEAIEALKNKADAKAEEVEETVEEAAEAVEEAVEEKTE